MRKIFFLLVMTICLWVPFAVFAREEGKEQEPLVIEIPDISKSFLTEPSLVPGSPFYGVKRFFEKLGDWLTVGKANQAKRDLNLALERLSESDLLLERGRIEEAFQLLSEYSRHLEKAGQLINRIKDETEWQGLLAKLENTTEDHRDYLDLLSRQLPDVKAEGFFQAILTSEKWHEYARSIRQGTLQKIDEIKENIRRRSEIEREIEEMLRKKLEEERKREQD